MSTAQPNPARSGSRLPADDPRAGMERPPEQAAYEDAMVEVSRTLTNIEDTIRRAERATAW